MRNSIYLIVVAVLFTACSVKNESLTFEIKDKKEAYYSSKKAQKISMPELLDEVKQYKVVFVGDHHNTEATHNFFNEVLEKLAKQGYTLHLANEWFSPSHDKLLLDYTTGKINSKELKEKREWKKFTRYRWDLVEKLYETVKKSNGKLYGMNILKKQRSKISLKEVSKMSEEENKFYDSLDLNVFPHKNLVLPYFEHCNKMPVKSAEPCEERMYRVQVTWDTYMAEQADKIAKKVLKTPKDILFVFAGAMHIEKGLGIPLRFARLNNTPFITISNYKIQKDEDIKIDINKANLLYLYE